MDHDLSILHISGTPHFPRAHDYGPFVTVEVQFWPTVVRPQTALIDQVPSADDGFFSAGGRSSIVGEEIDVFQLGLGNAGERQSRRPIRPGVLGQGYVGGDDLRVNGSARDQLPLLQCNRGGSSDPPGGSFLREPHQQVSWLGRVRAFAVGNLLSGRP